MREVLAFFRRDALVAASYRTGMVLSMTSLLTLVVPLFFVARAVQPLVGPSIGSEGGQYFAFVIIGMATFQFVMTAVGSVPAALGSALRTGTFEALLATPTRFPMLLLGMMGYPFAWTVARAAVLLVAGWILGAHLELERIVIAILIWGLVTLAYLPFGLLAAALQLVARTPGPLPGAVLTASMFLGGVYYPTTVIPSWLGELANVVPLTYGLRALRRVFAADPPVAAIASDLGMLAMLAVVLLFASMATLQVALRHARTAGALAHY